MINDIVCEYMVKRKLDISQIAKGVGVIVGGLGLTFLISSLGAYADMTGGMMGAMRKVSSCRRESAWRWS